jgi:hypothetical protein
MNDITVVGHIVHDKEGIIHGCGYSADDAWADMLRTMKHANIKLLDDDADTSKQSGSWALASDMQTAPATAALLQHVIDHGGDCTWGKVGIVACTVEEEEEEAG